MTIFDCPISNLSTTVAAACMAGATSITIAAGSGSLFGTVSPSSPVRILVIQASGLNSNGLVADPSRLTVFRATGRTGDTLTGLSVVEGQSAINFAPGDTVTVSLTAGMLEAIQDAVNALEETSISSADTYDDPAWITSLAGSKIVGNIAGDAAGLSANIAQSQVTNLVADLAATASGLASYIVQTAANAPADAQILATLATGLVKVTTGTGALSTAAAGTDYLAPNGSGAALTGVVHTVGAESIAGGKTFVDSVGFGDGTGQPTININGATSQVRDLAYRTANVNRWLVRVDNSPESGANAGSNFLLEARTDSGGFAGDWLQINRASGLVTIGAATISQAGAHTGAWQGAIVAAQYGGTGVDAHAAANGSLLIGNGSGFALAQLTAGANITITPAAGGITIAATPPTVPAGATGNVQYNNAGAFGGAAGLLYSSSASGVAFTIRPAAANTGDCQQITNPGGTAVLYGFDAKGRPYTAASSTPSNVPSASGGSGAGTSPSLVVQGTDADGVVVLNTGTSPAPSALVATMSFSSPYTSGPKTIILTPANTAAALLSGAAKVWADQGGISAGGWTLNVGTTALAASTQYRWYYLVIG